MVTAHEPLEALPLRPAQAMVFGGHDPRDTPLREAAADLSGRSGILDRALVERVADDLEEVESRLRPAPTSADAGADRKSTRLNSSHIQKSRMPSSA